MNDVKVMQVFIYGVLYNRIKCLLKGQCQCKVHNSRFCTGYAYTYVHNVDFIISTLHEHDEGVTFYNAL